MTVDSHRQRELMAELHLEAAFNSVLLGLSPGSEALPTVLCPPVLPPRPSTPA